MRKIIVLLFASLVVACSSTAPAPPDPEPPPATPTPAPAAAPASLGEVRVTASTLNVRREPSGEVIAQVRRNDRLTLLAAEGDWMQVRLASGETGWVSRQHVTTSTASRAPAPRQSRRRGGCPPDSDYSFVKAPTPRFSDSDKHGLVVVEANVNANGDVTSTKVVSNSTGDESLAFLAQQELKSAKFAAPVRNCVAKAFIFTYKRSF